MRKAFYVRCPKEGDQPGASMCTSLQVIVPDDMPYDQAVEYVSDLVSKEFRRYMVHECLRSLGVSPR